MLEVYIVRWAHKPVCRHVFSSPIYAVFPSFDGAEACVASAANVDDCALVIETWAV